MRHPRESAPAGNWCLRHRCGSDENQYRSTRLPEIATATPFSGYAAQPFQCDIAPIRPSPAHAHHLGTLVDVRMHRGYVRLQLADKAPTRTPIGCCANTCTRTPTCPRSPRTRSTLSPRKSTTARVECSGGQPRPRLSVLPSPRRRCFGLRSGAVLGYDHDRGHRRLGPRACSRRDPRRMRRCPRHLIICECRPPWREDLGPRLDPAQFRRIPRRAA